MTWRTPENRSERDAQTVVGGPTAFNKATWLGPLGQRSVVQPGLNPDVDTVVESVWHGGGLRPYPAAPLTITLNSALADDGKTVRIQWLAEDYALRPPASLVLNSAAPPTLDGVLRVLRMDLTSGSDLTADVTADSGGTTYEVIPALDCQSKSCTWTVPQGFIASIVTARVVVEKAAEISYWIATREAGTDCWQRQIVANKAPEGIWAMIDIPPEHGWAGIRLSEGEDAELRCVGGAPNNEASAWIRITLIEDPR